MRWNINNMVPEEGDILFEDDFWYVLKLDSLIAADPFDHELLTTMKSGIGHACTHFTDPGHIQILGGDDALAGICWWCKDFIPKSVQTVWTLHNFDYIRTVDMEMVEYCKMDRKETIEKQHWKVQWGKESE